MIPLLKKSKGLDVKSVWGMRGMSMWMNTLKVKELKDKRVRQALNYAVDKWAIIKSLAGGQGEPLAIAAQPKVPGIDSSLKPYPYDPEKAKALLKEAGYPNGFSLNVFSMSGRFPMDKEVAQAVANQLSKVGIKTKINIMETGAFIKKFTKKELEGILLIAMSLPTWDGQMLNIMARQEHPFSQYHSEKMDPLIKESSITVDREKRYQILYKIQKMMHDEAIAIPLYAIMENYGMSKKVKGFRPRPDAHLDLWDVSLTE